MSYEVFRILQILACIIVAVPGISVFFQAHTTAGRATAGGLTLLGLILSWEIAYFIYRAMFFLLEVLMFFVYICIDISGVLSPALPVIIFIGWLFDL